MKKLGIWLVTAFAIMAFPAGAQDLGGLLKGLQDITKLAQSVTKKPEAQTQPSTAPAEQAATGSTHSAEAGSLLNTVYFAYVTQGGGVIPSDCRKQYAIDDFASHRALGRNDSVSAVERQIGLGKAIATGAKCGLYEGAGSPWTEYLAVDLLAYYASSGYMGGSMQPVDMYAVGRHFGGYEKVKAFLEKQNIFDPNASSREDRTAGVADLSVTADKFLEEFTAGNALAFQSKYDGKVVTVSGVVMLVAPMKDYRNQAYVFLSMRHSDRNRFVGLSVSCKTYDTATIEQFKTLETKKAYKVQGRYTHRQNASGPGLDKCSLVSKL